MSRNHNSHDGQNRTAISTEDLQVGKKYSNENPPTSGFGNLSTIGVHASKYTVGVDSNWFVVIQEGFNGNWWKPVFVSRIGNLGVSDARDIDSFGQNSFAQFIREDSGGFVDMLIYSPQITDIEDVSKVSDRQVTMTVYHPDRGRAEVTLRQ